MVEACTGLKADSSPGMTPFPFYSLGLAAAALGSELAKPSSSAAYAHASRESRH
jgi:hypothetical protein